MEAQCDETGAQSGPEVRMCARRERFDRGSLAADTDHNTQQEQTSQNGLEYQARYKADMAVRSVRPCDAVLGARGAQRRSSGQRLQVKLQ